MKSLLDDPIRCRWCGIQSGAGTRIEQGGRRDWKCSCGHENRTFAHTEAIRTKSSKRGNYQVSRSARKSRSV